MATLGRLTMGLFLDSEPAEKGLDKAKKKTVNTAAAMESASKKTGNLTKSFSSLATVVKIASGIALAEFAFSAGKGIVDTFGGIIDAGGQFETTAIKMAYLAGSWAEGVDQLGRLREASVTSGLALDGLVGGFQDLVAAGVSAHSAVGIVEEMGNAAQLLGGGAIGIRKITGAMAGLLEETIANKGALAGLEGGGLKVYQALADYLTKTTGRVHTVKDALFALKNGAVLSATALNAIKLAANGPEVALAAERFANSFEGQIARISTTLKDLLASYGKGIIDLIGLPKILSWVRGSLEGLRTIVGGLVEKAGGIFDPANAKKGIVEAFHAGKLVAIDIAQVIVNGALQAAKILADAVDMVGGANALANRGKFLVANPIDALQMGAARAIAVAGEGMGLVPKGAANIIAQDINRAAGNARGAGQANGAAKVNQLQADADRFFADQRRKAAIPQNPQPGINLQAEAAAKQAEAAKNAAAATETWRTSILDWSRTATQEMQTPFEKFAFEMEKARSQYQQILPGMKLFNDEQKRQIQTVFLRKQSGFIGDLLKEFSPADSFRAQRAEGGSASAVESLVRNRFSESNQDPQARLETAIQRGNILAERNLQYQQQLLNAAVRAKVPGVIQL